MQNKFKLYYDGACPLCAREINSYKKKDLSSRIDYIDTSTTNFNAEALGLDAKAINNYLHLISPEGTIYTGIDAFIILWKELEIFKVLTFICSSRLGKPLAKVFYVIFAQGIRPYLSKKQCKTDQCSS